MLPHSLRDQTLLKLQVKGFLNRSAAGSAPERGRSPRLSPVWLCWQWQNLAASPCWSAPSQAGLRFQGHVKAHLVQGMSAPAASRDPCRSRGSWAAPWCFPRTPRGWPALFSLKRRRSFFDAAVRLQFRIQFISIAKRSDSLPPPPLQKGISGCFTALLGPQHIADTQ